MKQEKALFVPTPGIRKRFVVAGRGKTTDPVILDFLCKHRELFLPNTKKKPFVNRVVVSSTFRWVRDLERMRGAGGLFQGECSYVLASLYEDSKAKPGKMKNRTLVFMLENGKIDPTGILLDGFGGRASFHVIMDEVKVKNVPADSWEFRPKKKVDPR